MALILNIETSSKVCSVSIHEDGELKGYSEIHILKSHSQILTVIIQELIDNTGLTVNDFDAIAVSGGPGSYTGLRIGVSAAKGICYGVEKPLIAIDTLLIMASEVNSKNFRKALLIPMIDARRMEVYCSVFDNELNTIEKSHPLVLTDQAFVNHLNQQEVLIFGDGSEKASTIIKSGNATFVNGIYPSAKWMGQISERLYQEQRFVDVAYFEPYYLKEFVSTAKIVC